MDGCLGVQVEHAALAICLEWQIALRVRVRQDAERQARQGWLPKQSAGNRMTEREIMEYDVVVVGAGPAGLAFAIRLKQLDAELRVCVLEKASTVGAQILSGAVIEPAPLDALLPGWRDNPPPICVPATHDEFLLLRDAKRATKLPTPPQMHNRGNFIVSLGALCAWLAPQAEALGVDIFQIGRASCRERVEISVVG